MGFRVGDVLGLICSPPLVCISVLLLFTPPLFPIVVYFSPLLISTALVVLAMVSMGSHVEPPRPVVETEVHYYRRGWIEEISEEGPELEEERELKTLKAASPKGDRWLKRMKSWKGTGRAWIESVRSQESDASLGDDQRGPGTRKRDSRPFLSAAKELFSHESNKQKFARHCASQEAADRYNQSPLTVVTPVSSEIVDSRTRELVEVTKNVKTEITSQISADGGSTRNSSESGPSSPLFRSRTASRREADGPTCSRDLKADDVKSMAAEDSSKATQIVCSSSVTEKGKEKDLAIQHVAENHVTLAPGKKDRAETSNKVETEEGGKAQTLEIVPVESQGASRTPLDDENVQKTEVLVLPGDKDWAKKKATSPECVAQNGTANGSGVVSDKPYPIGAPQIASSRSSRLATELPGQGKAPGGADSPSAAVALSEKLKVPLADILSLLAGDDKENAKLESGSGVKPTTSSEFTTSQEEDWSSSDGESTAAPPESRVDGGGAAPSEEH